MAYQHTFVQQQQTSGVYPSAPPQQYAPPTYPQAPPPQSYAMPPQGMPPPQAMPPPQGMPPPQAMPPPQGMPPAQGAPPVPQQAVAQLPSGYNMLDAFRNGNILQLISRSTGYPLIIRNNSLMGNGSFAKNDSLFKVVVPDKAGPGVIMLQNVEWPGVHIAIKGHKVQTSKANDHCHLRVHVQPDNYVVFEGVKSAGEYVAMQKNDVPPEKVKDLGSNDDMVQFFVRVQRQKHPYSQTIMTPFGRPSIANQLRDGSIIQLYLKPSTYLSINSNGIILSTSNGGDKHTFFELVDRGMGIVSLHSKQYPGYRLRMNNYVLEGKGDPTLVADWRLKENADATVQFESVVCPGTFVCINQGGVLHKNISIFLVNIQRFGGAETITKSPLN